MLNSELTWRNRDTKPAKVSRFMIISDNANVISIVRNIFG